MNAIRIGRTVRSGWWTRAARASTGRRCPGLRLIRIDLATNTVTRSYDLAAALTPTSFVDDVRLNGRHAYLTDARSPGLVVLDLATGWARRVLDHDPNTTARRPTRAEGRELRNPQGRSVFVEADQLEVSPDGRRLYLQPCDGGFSVVDTSLLDDPAFRRRRCRGGFAASPPHPAREGPGWTRPA